MTTRKVFLFIAFSWSIACGAQIFALPGYYFIISTKACEIMPRFKKEFSIYVTFLVPFLFGISFISMTVFYSRVICELRWKHNQILSREQLAVNGVHKRITFMLISDTVIFAATWKVGSTFGIWFMTYVKGTWQLMKSSVNCFLYTLFSTLF